MALLVLLVPALAQAQSFSQTTPGAWTYTVPANVYYLTVTSAGGGGGGGGFDASGRGGTGGAGKSVTAYIRVNPGDTLTGVVAAGGGLGASPRAVAACTGAGVGGSGAAAGGRGGQQSCTTGYSGAGGGGGGASSVLLNNVPVLITGGGGGGGGGGLNNPATLNSQSATTLTSSASCSAAAGLAGTNAPGDGGGGGGGGAGSTGGAGGSFGADSSAAVPSTGGGAGGSCHVGNLVTIASQGAGGSGGVGSNNAPNGSAGGNGLVNISPSVATLALRKSKISGDSTPVSVTLTATNLAAVPAGLTSATADNTPGSANAPVAIINVGANVTVTETVTGQTGFSLVSASCVDATTNTSFVAATSGTTVTIPPANMMPASAITCTLLNSKASGVLIRKQSIGGVGTFNFALSNLMLGNSPAASASLNTGSSNPATSASYTWSGSGNVTITESAASGYTTSHVCADSNAATNGNATPRIPASGVGSGGTVTIPASALLPNASWVCTFTNTRPRTLTVTKALLPATDAGQFVMVADGSTGTAGGNGATVANTNVAVGSTVTFSETAANAGTRLANYASAISCVQTVNSAFNVAFTPASADNQGGSLVMPDADVTCTITNTRKTLGLRLAKAWSGGANAGVTATIPATTGFINNTGVFTAAGGAAVSSATAVVYAGETGNLNPETMNGANLAYFNATLSCDNGVVPAGTNGKASNAVTIPTTLAAGTTITCTYTNARTSSTLTLAKVVNNATGGTATPASFTLQAAGPSTISGASGTAPVTNATVPSGVYTLSEVNLPDYTASAWTCTNGVAVTSGQITLATGASTTCTITNTFTNAANLSITKTNNATSAVSGQPTTYQIVISNTGPANAHGAVIRDQPGTGLGNCAATCSGVTNGATCPDTLSNIFTPAGEPIRLLPANGTVTLNVTCSVN